MQESFTISGRYKVERLIGQGGIGEVYYGVDLETDQPVAIKALKPHVIKNDPQIVERFRREGEALRDLNHPCIVKMLAAVEENGQNYLVMEYVEGGSLYDLLRREGKLPLERVLVIALDLSDALTRAHRLQIIHRDIKPANVLIAVDGTPRLTDFGTARLGTRQDLTSEGDVVGTVVYLSPEACQGERVDARADIWAFGVMLFEMLTGRRPFDRAESLATIISIVRDPLPDLVALMPDAPSKLVNLIYNMLEKDPAKRIGSMRLVGAELESIIQQADTGVKQALDLIYRMLERDPNQPISGVRLVDGKLESVVQDASPTAVGSVRARPIALEQFERSGSDRTPTSIGSGPNRMVIAGVALAILVIIAVVVLLLVV